MFHNRANEYAGNDSGADAHNGKGEAHVALIPGITILGVQDIDRLK
jgi:hypothetical protein